MLRYRFEAVVADQEPKDGSLEALKNEFVEWLTYVKDDQETLTALKVISANVDDHVQLWRAYFEATDRDNGQQYFEEVLVRAHQQKQAGDTLKEWMEEWYPHEAYKVTKVWLSTITPTEALRCFCINWSRNGKTKEKNTTPVRGRAEVGKDGDPLCAHCHRPYSKHPLDECPGFDEVTTEFDA